MKNKLILLCILICTSICVNSMEDKKVIEKNQTSFWARVYKKTLGNLFKFTARFFKKKQHIPVDDNLIDDFETILDNEPEELTNIEVKFNQNNSGL